MTLATIRRPEGPVAAQGTRKGEAVALKRLTLTDFRNYADLRLDTGPEPVVLTGANGAGKTNLLEAISMLAPGRGLRGAAFDDLRRMHDATSWAVAAEIDGPGGTTALGTAWTRPSRADDPATAARQIRVGGETRKSSGAFSDYVRIQWLVPAMDRLFTGPAGDRRRFLDRLVIAFDPEHGRRVMAFEKLLRERNRLLAEPGCDAAWLGSVEHGLGDAAVAVAAARAAAIEALQGYMNDMRAARERSAFPWATLDIDGELERLVRHRPAVQIEDEYRRMLRDSRGLDRAAGRCLKGPHRSDLVVVHGPKGADARVCSTGEQKALLISLVLAHARAVRAAFDGWAPLMLLDEVAAHLDEARRIGLFDEIAALGVQAWMTGTDARLFEPLAHSAQFFRIGDGTAVSERP